MFLFGYAMTNIIWVLFLLIKDGNARRSYPIYDYQDNRLALKLHEKSTDQNNRRWTTSSFSIAQNIRGGSTLELTRSTGTNKADKKRQGKKSVQRTPRKKKKKKKKKQPVLSTAQGDGDTQNKYMDSFLNDETNVNINIPKVKAILVPRQISIPQIFRSLAAISFIGSLCWAVHTSGMPYEKAIASSMRQIWPTYDPKLTAVNEYIVKNILPSSTLPNKNMPSFGSIMGMICSILILHLGLTVLLPNWSIPYYVWLHFTKLDTSIHSWKQIAQHLQPKEHDDDDYYYKSAYANRVAINDKKASFSTRLALWVEDPSHYHRDETNSLNDIIPWVQYCKSFSNLKSKDIHPHPYYVEWNQRRIYLDFNTNYKNQNINITITDGGPDFFQTGRNVTNLLKDHTTGLANENKHTILAIEERYGPYANISLPTPEIRSIFISRITSPLAVVQFIGKILNMIEENFFSSVFNICVTLAHYYHDAMKTIKHAQTLTQEVVQEEQKYQTVWVLRNVGKKRNKKKWISLPSHKLLPGDVFGISSSENANLIMPVDALLLEGACVANEAVLTGESVPQPKTPLEEDSNCQFDMDGEHRNSVLFAGTNILYCTDDNVDVDDNQLYPPMPQKNMAKCLVLKIGSYSSRGEIVRALSKSKNTGTAAVSTPESDRDALILIASLSVFASLACISLFIPSLQHKIGKSTSYYRRIIQCSRIAVACIPSDLPLALSAITHSCSANLRKESDVACAKSGHLLTSSQVDVVVFDKTGTLTADTQRLKMIVGPPTDRSRNEKLNKNKLKKRKHKNDVLEEMDIQTHHTMENLVLAGCHSIVAIDENKPVSGKINNQQRTKSGRLVGDPLDLVSLKFSGWAFDGYKKTAVKSSAIPRTNSTLDPVQMWIIKSFPFDPNRRMSSSILLVLHSDNKFRIWKTVKGSPDSMRNLLVPRLNSEKAKEQVEIPWYDNMCLRLGSKGMRLIAMGVKDVTKNRAYNHLLFPKGVIQLNKLAQKYGDKKDKLNTSIFKMVKKARSIAKKSIHRDDLERSVSDIAEEHSIESECSLEFAGFACFDAPIRPSSSRVVGELKRSGVNVSMLTGDGTDAAIHVAKEVNIIGFVDSEGDIRACETIAILDLKSPDSENNVEYLEWSHTQKKETKGDVIYGKKSSEFSSKSVSKIIRKHSSKKCAIVATGRAIEFAISVLENQNGKGDLYTACKYLLENLSRINVISRASPQLKQLIIRKLKATCSHKVMMCGDGVNDIAAMKTADVSVALLTGYGSESKSEITNGDVEDERRKEKYRIKHNIVPKRIMSDVKSLEEYGIGSSPIAVQARIKRHINSALVMSGNEFIGFKKNFQIFRDAIIKERERSKLLNKGGGAAARILAEEEKLRASLLQKADFKEINDPDQSHTLETDENEGIKPGEACLAAAFTFLRPCIDGADAIIRMGIAASANYISTHQSIALNCLMSCFNLATLYRDGFRYGKYMWNVELAFIMGIDRARYAASCTPRPHIASERPYETIFHPASALSILCQALVHLVCLQTGVDIASNIDNDLHSGTSLKFKIQWRENIGVSPKAIERLASSLASNSFMERAGSNKQERTFFGRPPFTPNHITNSVFLISIFQNSMVALINHRGRPFYGSILENRQFCQWLILSIGLCILLSTETFPAINRVLELAPMPKRKDKMRMLVLFFVDFVGCFVLDRLCKHLFDDGFRHTYADHNKSTGFAADLEERILSDERKRNRFLISVVLFCLAFITIGSL